MNNLPVNKAGDGNFNVPSGLFGFDVALIACTARRTHTGSASRKVHGVLPCPQKLCCGQGRRHMKGHWAEQKSMTWRGCLSTCTSQLPSRGRPGAGDRPPGQGSGAAYSESGDASRLLGPPASPSLVR